MKQIIAKCIKNKLLLSFISSYLIYCSLCYQGILVSYNILSIVIFGVIFYFIYNTEKKLEYKKELSFISILFSFVLLIGRILYNNRYSPTLDFFDELLNLKSIIYFLGNEQLIYFVLMNIIPKLIKLKNSKKERNIPRLFLISFFVIIVCYIPYLITFFPGILTGDSITEMSMIKGVIPISDQHTIAHLLFMIIPFKIGTLLFKNINLSVGLISITQIVVMALSFAYVIMFLKKREISNKLVFIILIYYALLPVNGFYSITLWKDIFFSCSMVLFTIECYKLLEKKGNITLKNSYMFIVTSLLVIFTRNNAIYMYMIFTVVTIYMFRKNIKTIGIMLMIVLITYITVKGPIYNYLKISKSSSAEYLAIPLQQVGRMAYKDVKFTKKEENMINKIIPVKELKKSYNPEIVDPIKFNKKYNSKEFEKNKIEYLKIWSNLCYKHPKIAIESYLISTLGYWYPGTEYWVTTGQIDSNNLGIHNYTFIPKTAKKYAIKNIMNSNPIFGFFNCIGLYFWLIIILAYITMKKIDKKYLYIYTPVFGIWLTMMIAAPVFSEFRYIYSAVICLPLYFGLIYTKK